MTAYPRSRFIFSTPPVWWQTELTNKSTGSWLKYGLFPFKSWKKNLCQQKCHVQTSLTLVFSLYMFSTVIMRHGHISACQKPNLLSFVHTEKGRDYLVWISRKLTRILFLKYSVSSLDSLHHSPVTTF